MPSTRVAVGDRERRAAGVADAVRRSPSSSGGHRAAQRLARARRPRRPRPCGSRGRRGRSRSSASAPMNGMNVRAELVRRRGRAACSCSLASTTIERPSGVSSARLASCAASASSSTRTPATGMNSVAMRLPSVIVPVLSSSSVSTSPAASTARPLIAMHVLAQQAVHAGDADGREQAADGGRDQADEQRDDHGRRERDARVERRAAPASRRRTGRRASGRRAGCAARSRWASSAAPRPRPARSCGRGTTRPGSAVMRTTMRSESTLVPPVTAERSPPLSRMTGADSPVIADSSTEAMPSTTSPSPGMSSPGLDDHDVALAQRATPATVSSRAVDAARRAVVSLRILRSVAACALPRPSATASAKLAKTTVNQSQSVTAPVNQSGARAVGRERRCRAATRTVVSTLPTSTTNMTGFLATCAGASLRKLSLDRRPEDRAVEQRDAGLSVAWPSEHLSVQRPGSARRSGRAQSAGKKVSAPTMTIDADEQPGEERAVGREGARARRAPSSCRPSSRRSPAPGRS